MRVVISQSMYFPWVGLLEQVKLADVFVHYNDVQFTKGFYNRVQIKTDQGTTWLTVPLQKHPREALIDQVLATDTGWREDHRNLFRTAYKNAPFLSDALTLMEQVYSGGSDRLSDIARTSIEVLIDYFDLASTTQFADSGTLGIGGRSSQRLLDITKRFGGDRYVTGHGARNYLDEDLFAEQGVAVEYMRYQRSAYPQLHGSFTPYVSSLDLVANCGREGRSVIISDAGPWEEDMMIRP